MNRKISVSGIRRWDDDLPAISPARPQAGNPPQPGRAAESHSTLPAVFWPAGTRRACPRKSPSPPPPHGSADPCPVPEKIRDRSMRQNGIGHPPARSSKPLPGTRRKSSFSSFSASAGNAAHGRRPFFPECFSVPPAYLPENTAESRKNASSTVYIRYLLQLIIS